MSKRWANKMRRIYITGFILLVVIVATPGVYKYFTKPATCFDGVQNQGETAIDRSGPCRLLDAKTLKPLNELWARSFAVIPGLYSAITYVENPNLNGGIRNIKYIFKLYDENNIIVAEKTGETFIPPGKVVPIFEGNLQAGNRVPKRTTFQFIERPIWEVMQGDRAAEIIVAEKQLKEVGGAPRASAEIQNRGVYALSRLVVVAVLFDEAGNAIGASRSVIESLPAGSSHNVVFTWPKAFESFVARVDIVPLLPPIDSL